MMGLRALLPGRRVSLAMFPASNGSSPMWRSARARRSPADPRERRHQLRQHPARALRARRRQRRSRYRSCKLGLTKLRWPVAWNAARPAGWEFLYRSERPSYRRPLRFLARESRLSSLHRQFLEVVKLELEGAGIRDINNVQAMMLFNIGDAEMTVGELTLARMLSGLERLV
jgi:hypothetical protein